MPTLAALLPKGEPEAVRLSLLSSQPSLLLHCNQQISSGSHLRFRVDLSLPHLTPPPGGEGVEKSNILSSKEGVPPSKETKGTQNQERLKLKRWSVLKSIFKKKKSNKQDLCLNSLNVLIRSQGPQDWRAELEGGGPPDFSCRL